LLTTLVLIPPDIQGSTFASVFTGIAGAGAAIGLASVLVYEYCTTNNTLFI